MLFSLLFTLFAHATPIVQVEVDPLPYALGGAAGHVRVALPGAEQWTLGAGLYAQEMPAPLLTLAAKNRGEDWSASLAGVGLFADYYLNNPVSGTHIGAQVAAHRWSVENPEGDARFASLLVMPRVGYLWLPIDNAGLYLDPWVGVGGTVPLAGSRTVGDDAFALFPVMFFGALHVGWRFGPRDA